MIVFNYVIINPSSGYDGYEAEDQYASVISRLRQWSVNKPRL